MKALICSNCGSSAFFALETVHARRPVAFYGERNEAGQLEVEIEESGAAEFIHEAATSVVIAYLCVNEECNKVINPALGFEDALKEQSHA